MDDDYDYSPDDEDSQSLGAYENMERANTRPDFLANTISSTARDVLRSGEDSASSEPESSGSTPTTRQSGGSFDTDNFSKKLSQKAGEKALKIGLNAATGGVGGTAVDSAEKVEKAEKTANALKDAEKASAASAKQAAENANNAANLYQQNKDQDINKKKKAKIKKAAKALLPVAFIIVALCALTPLLGSFSPLSFFGKAFSSIMKRNSDSATLVNHKVTDFQMNNTQLGGMNSGSEWGDVAFEGALELTDYQIEAFERAGLKVEGNNLIHTNADGSKTVIVPDPEVTGTAYYGDEDIIGEGNGEYADSGINAEAEEQRRAEIAAEYGLAASSNVVKYSEIFKEILKDPERFKIRNEFIAATDTYRGGMGAWYSHNADKTAERLGVDFDTFKDFQNTNDNQSNEQYIIDTSAEITNRNGGGSTNQSLDQLAQKAISESKNQNGGCAFDSAAAAVGGVANGIEAYKQTVAGEMFMESIDKTYAGYGAHSPMSAILNLLYKSGGMNTAGIAHLFSNNKPIDQSNDDILTVSAQANLGSNGTVQSGGLGEDADTCVYAPNLNEHDGEGSTSRIGNMFRKVSEWVQKAINTIKTLIKEILDFFKQFLNQFSFFSRKAESAQSGGGGAPYSAISPAISQKLQPMTEKTGYFTGEDGKELGEALVSSAERISNEISKSVDATMSGDTNATETAFKVREEVIAERADYERTTKSPFDPTSEYTFLGKIAYSLLPLAFSNSSKTPLTSTVSQIGSVVSNSAISLLPTSSATSLAKLELNQGDCLFSNSIGSFSNVHCNNYQTFDLKTIKKDPTTIWNKTAGYRRDYDYTYGINKEELSQRYEGRDCLAEEQKKSPTAVSCTADGRFLDFDPDRAKHKGHIPQSEVIYVDEDGRPYDSAEYHKDAINESENDAGSYWGYNWDGEERENDVDGEDPHGCESDWEYEVRFVKYADGSTREYRNYYFENPTEWKYWHLTNFEYEGYKTGFPNMTDKETVAWEEAVNDADPGTCMLDLKKDEENEPVINLNGPLAIFALMNGERTSEFGVADQNNIDTLGDVDYLHGRLNPCDMGPEKGEREDNPAARLCDQFVLYQYGWKDTEKKNYIGDDSEKDDGPDKYITQNAFLARPISGSAFVNYTPGSENTGLITRGYEQDNIFIDSVCKTNGETEAPYMQEKFRMCFGETYGDGDYYFTTESTLYSAYISMLEWMESIDLLEVSGISDLLDRYYELHPMDNSIAGIIARYTGYSKDAVIAVFDLLDYVEWLANYNPSNLYPLGPKTTTTLEYDNNEVIALYEPLISNMAIVYDELRNRTVVA